MDDFLVTGRMLRECIKLCHRAGDFGVRQRLTPEQIALADGQSRRMRMPPWADGRAIRAIYAEAERLTRETGEQHHVDHVIPLKGVYVSGLHVETNLSVLRAADNIRKSNRYEP